MKSWLGDLDLGALYRRVLTLAAFALVGVTLAAHQPAHAQFSDGYNFLKAVRDADGAKVNEMVGKSGASIVNSRDSKNGETGLHIVVRRRDLTWLSFLLGNGANPNLDDYDGTTPLMAAIQNRFVEGVQVLLDRNAAVDKPNNSGETPLIRAVQLRDLALVRMLVAEGANPDKRDSLAGMSALDYAKRDGRTPGLIDALAKPSDKKRGPTTGPVQGPTF